MSASQRTADLLAAASVALLCVALLIVCGRPLATDDSWFHLKMGEVYATQGLWPDGDPLLHTAHDEAPVQHEWLFGVTLFSVHGFFGFHGLRIAHVLAVAGILALAWSIIRRKAASFPAAALVACVFVLLAAWRLIQLRPDLVSIAATLVLYRLLLEPEKPPSWYRVAGAVALFVLWANAHSLFAIGLALLVAALLGLALRAILRSLGGGTQEQEEATLDAARARRWAAALALGALASLLNPRGIHQHLTFFESSKEAAIWAIYDEWSHFDPFSWPSYGAAVSVPVWAVTDLLLAGFLLVVLWDLGRATRLPRAAPRLPDSVLLGLGAASVVAMLTAIRFLWMGLFPLLFLAAPRPGAGETPESIRRVRGTPALLLAAGCLVVTGMALQVLRGTAVPSGVGAYLAAPYNAHKFHAEGVQFLQQARVEGNLFNSYYMGGFLGYWLSPRMRTFIDGRTEHYPPDVLQDYLRVSRMLGTDGADSFLDLLDRRHVDAFFGIGVPSGDTLFYTSTHLEGAPGWILVSRSRRHAIHLRANRRNRQNLVRVADYYAGEGVPFDPQRGLDPAAVIRDRPAWAERHGMVPAGYAELREDSSSPDPELRFRALDRLGRAYVLVGAYREQIALDRESVALRPRARTPRRRLVYGNLRLGRADDALEEALELQRVAPDDPLTQQFLAAARLHSQPQADALDPADAQRIRREELHRLDVLRVTP